VTDAFALPDGPALAAVLGKMIATALFVVIIALISERIGPFFGAMVASLPIYSGPIYLVLAFEHTPDYLAQAALGSVAISGAMPVFSLIYCALALRFGMVLSLSGAVLGWVLAALAVRSHTWTIAGAALFCAVVYGAAVPLSRGFTRAAAAPQAPRGWIDLPLRAGLVAIFVGVVTALSKILPPVTTGILSVVPIIFASLILVLHPRVGGAATAVLIAHSIAGMVGMCLAFIFVHLTIWDIGTGPALLMGLGISIAWNLLLIFAQQGLGWLRR
jgi:hypothetical protein